MNRRGFRSVPACLLLGAAMLQGCTTGMPPVAQGETPPALAVPTPASGISVARPSPVALDSNPTPPGTALALVVVPAPSASTPVQSSPTRPGTNITQAEYKTALAKWQAHGVSEYEIMVWDETGFDYLGKVRLRIKVEHGVSQVVGYTDLNGDQPQPIALGMLSQYDQDYLRGLTVEGRFRLLGTLFEDVLMALQGYYAYYEVTFDPVFGYPTRVYSSESDPDDAMRYDVLSLRILKSSVPGMPRTGGVGP